MKPRFSNIKKFLFSLAAAVLMSLFCTPQAKADGDAFILAPLLEAWQSSQLYQYTQQMQTALNQWATQLESLEKGKEMAKFMRDAYGKLQTGEAYYNAFKTLYFNNKSLLDACLYGYEWLRDSIEEGTVDISTAAQFTALLEYLYRKSWSNANYAYQLFSNDTTGLTLEEKFRQIAKKSKETANDAAAVDGVVKRLQEDALATAQGKLTSTLLALAYGSKAPLPNYYKIDKNSIKPSDARKDVKNNTQELNDIINSDSGKQLRKVQSALRGGKFTESILNLVCAIIGILAVIMAIPAYLKVTRGERQSADVLYKLFMGTIAIIAIIQVFGRFFLSLA